MVERIRPFAVSVALGAVTVLGIGGMVLPKTDQPFTGVAEDGAPPPTSTLDFAASADANGTVGPADSAEAVLLPDMATLVASAAPPADIIPPAPAVLPPRKPATPVHPAAAQPAGDDSLSLRKGADDLIDTGAAALWEAGDKVGQAAETVYGHGKAAGSALVGAISRNLPDW